MTALVFLLRACTAFWTGHACLELNILLRRHLFETPLHEPIMSLVMKLFGFCFRNFVFSGMTSSEVWFFYGKMKMMTVNKKDGELGLGLLDGRCWG